MAGLVPLFLLHHPPDYLELSLLDLHILIPGIYGMQDKGVIDEIVRVLARHYGFTDEELDFIINYDIKYRIGMTAEGEEEE